MQRCDSTALSTSVATSVLGQLPHTLTLTLTHSLTHSLTHYYYCTYCFYYGDYCQSRGAGQTARPLVGAAQRGWHHSRLLYVCWAWRLPLLLVRLDPFTAAACVCPHRYCFYYRDYQWLKRMWWEGNRVPDTTERTYSATGRPQTTGYQPGLGHVPTSWTPPDRLDLKPGGMPDEAHPAQFRPAKT